MKLLVGVNLDITSKQVDHNEDLRCLLLIKNHVFDYKTPNK